MPQATLQVPIEAVREAARGLVGVAVRTPLLEVPSLTALLGVSVLLKCEFQQPVGAFKLRGAYTAIRRLAPADRARGVITYSSGNHGLAVAYAARLHGVPAVIVMPETAPKVKVDGIRRYGGEVVFAGSRSVDRKLRAEEVASRRGLMMIPPFDHPDVIAGQATCGLEIIEQRPDVDTILVPVGGGGLLAGICTAVAAMMPAVRVVAVEPEGAAKLAAALAAGAPVALERTQSLADGLLPLSVGELTFPLIRDVVTDAVQVSEDEIAAAVRLLHRELGLTVEPSGAVTAAALLAGRMRPAGPVVAVATGGNVDPELFQRLVA